MNYNNLPFLIFLMNFSFLFIFFFVFFLCFYFLEIKKKKLPKLKQKIFASTLIIFKKKINNKIEKVIEFDNHLPFFIQKQNSLKLFLSLLKNKNRNQLSNYINQFFDFPLKNYNSNLTLNFQFDQKKYKMYFQYINKFSNKNKVYIVITNLKVKKESEILI